MDRQILIGTVFVLGVIFSALAYRSRRAARWTVYEFFLASRTLRPSFVTSLLVSGSFSLNGMLYQTYLGYKIGIWGLLPQVAWALSFVWLARYTRQLAGVAGLHDFLGQVFSPTTRRIAAVCSIAGLSLQIGWEYSVAKSAFYSLTNPHLNNVATIVLVSTVFAIATFYTLIGGLRSNSVTDMVQNLLKGACFATIGIFAFLAVGSSPGQIWSTALPPLDSAIVEFTISGLIANLAFSLVWQFVDMSTWQTATATTNKDGAAGAAKALRSASIWVFIAPGILGTFVGMALSARPGLDPNTVLPALLSSAGATAFILVVLAVALVATIMSFVDGMLLGIGYTVVTDLLFQRTVKAFDLLSNPTDERRVQPDYQEAVAKVMAGTRTTLIVAAIAGTLLLEVASAWLHLDLFQQVYIITLSQIALIGPVLMGLVGRAGRGGTGPVAIVASLVCGFGLVGVGAAMGSVVYTNLAPVGGMTVSLLLAFLGSQRSERESVSHEATNG